MAGPFDVQVPAWLQKRAIMNSEVPNWGGLAGTLLAGAVMSSRGGEPANGAESGQATDESGQEYTPRKSFWQGVGEARMNQQDPMWMLKAKAAEAQIENTKTLTQARWLMYDQRIQQSQRQQESLNLLGDYDGSTPVPAGITDPGVLKIADRKRADFVTAQLKSQKLENDLQTATARIENQAASLGLREQKLDLDRTKLEVQQDQFDRKIQAASDLEEQKQGGRMALEKARGLSRVDAASRPLTKLQFINRHLNTVFKDLQTNNPDPRKPITVQDAQKVLSDAFDSLPQEGNATKLPKVISITPAQ